MRSVTGTVKQTTEKGLVVVGRETGQKHDALVKSPRRLFVSHMGRSRRQ